MKIKLKNGKPALEETILELESALDCRLSASFRNFLLKNNGAEPETNIFKISEKNESGVNRFIPVGEIRKERERIENLPKKAYPIAWAEGGNYIFIDENKNGAVFFWDHELPQATTELAADFLTFLNVLEPFDIKTIKLKPGQVKKAWIDPEFLKQLKNKK